MAVNKKKTTLNKAPDVDRQRSRENAGYEDGLVESDDCWNIYDPNSGARSFDLDRALRQGSEQWSIKYGEDDYDQYPYYVEDNWYAWSEYQQMLVQALGELRRTRRLFHIWPAQERERFFAHRSGAGQPPSTSPAGIEQRVTRYLSRIGRLEDVRAELMEAVGEDLNVAMLVEHADTVDSPQLFNRLLLYAPFWLRNPVSFPGGDSRALIDHLFVAYPVPEYLYALWFRPSELINEFRWLGWFLTLAQGGSLYRLSRCDADTGWTVPRSFQHHLYAAPRNATPATACAAAEVFRLGGRARELRRILAYPAFVMDVTDAPRGACRVGLDHWRDTVRWLTRHGDAFDDNQSRNLLAWAAHEIIEDSGFSWSGRSVQASVRRATQYREQIMNTARGQSVRLSWAGHGLDWTCTDERQRHWTIAELTDSRALQDEGQALRHCVGSYAFRCHSGDSAIFSLRVNNQRCLTLELRPESWQLVQARGTSNRPWRDNEQQIIARWIDECIIPRVCADPS